MAILTIEVGGDMYIFYLLFVAGIEVAITTYTAETEEILIFEISTIAPAEYLESDKVLLPGAYAIGVAEPVSVLVNTFGTSDIDSRRIEDAVIKLFDLTPAGIINKLDLKKPIYSNLAAYGHMGREDIGVSFEKTDMAAALKAELN